MEKIIKPSVNVTIPVYNEEAELEERIDTLRRYLEINLTDFKWEITIADNASTDKTLQLAKQLSRKRPEIRVIHLDKKGRGRAVKTAWGQSGCDVVAYMDLDLSTDLKHFPPLVRSILRGYDIAIGSRNASGARIYGRNLLRTLTSKGYIILIKLFFWVHFSDAQCGFKAVSKRVAHFLVPKIQDNEWFFDTELLVIAEKLGLRIYEEPVTWVDNPGSTVRVYKTIMGDLRGLWRLFVSLPWKKLRLYARA